MSLFSRCSCAALLAGLLLAPARARAEGVAPGDAVRGPEPVGRMDARRYSGLVLFGLEGAVGGDRGVGTGDGTGAQLGMRFPFQVTRGRFELDLLLGARPFRGVMGEARARYDARMTEPERARMVVWGLWGFELTAMRGPTVWHSLIEVPRAHLGYRYAARDSGFELGGRLGWALIGRYNPQDASRPLGNSLTPGLYALVYSRHLFATLEARSFTPLTGSRGPVLHGDALLCGAHLSMSLCATGRGFRGNASPDDGSASGLASSWQLGLMLGLGERLNIHWGD